MRKGILFLAVFLFTFNLVNGKDLKSINRYTEPQKKFNYPADPCFQQLVHGESNLWFSITNVGLLGTQGFFWTDYPVQDLPMPSAQFPGGSYLEYLFMGAIWVGGIVEGETLVSVGADGWIWNYEMFPDSCPEGKIKKLEEFGDQEFVATYTDTLVDTGYDDPYDLRHKPLNVKITQHSYSWISPPYDDFVLLDYEVKNFGDKSVSKAYIGFYMDTDILHLSNSYGWVDDVTGFIKSIKVPEGTRKLDLAWAADNNGDLVHGMITSKSPIGVFGFKLLGFSNPEPKISYNWWVSEGNDPVNLDFGPWRKSNWDLWVQNYGIWCEGGKGTPCGDRAKYFLMSNGEFDYDQIYTCIDQSDKGWLPPSTIWTDLADGYDIKFLYSFGPFDIPAKDSINFAVGIIMGDSLHRGENPIDPQNPQAYYSNLDFDDLFRNVIMAQRVYESDYTMPPPGPPVNFRVVNIPVNEALFYWSKKKYHNLNGYNIYRANLSGVYPSTPLNEIPITDTSFIDKGLTEGDNYFYVIKSVNSSGIEGAPSKEIDFLAGRPLPPSGLRADVSEDIVRLRWLPHPEDDVIGYKIYRKEEGGDWIIIGGVGLAGKDTTFFDKEIEDGIVYYYRITALDRLELESFPSDSVYALSMLLEPGILLVDASNPDGRVFVQDDSVNAFYDRALQGFPFVYSKHDLPAIQYVSLKELSPHSVCIIHSEGRFGPQHESFANFDLTLVNLGRYLEAGGKLILAGKHIIQPLYSGVDWTRVQRPFKEGDFAYDFLHINSIILPLWICGREEFIGTHSTLLSEFSDLEVDTARVNLSCPKDRCDLQGKLPLIRYFVPLYPEEVIYTFNSAYDTSEFEGKAIGMRHMGEDYNVYFFNFPLYYIKEEQSVPLLHKILAEFGLLPTGVEEEVVPLPGDFSLGQNYPNPFNPATIISFTLSGSHRATLTIYNILGQKVKVVLDKEMIPGVYEVRWDGKDEKGKEVSSGVYFYQLKAGDYKVTKKMVLLR